MAGPHRQRNSKLGRHGLPGSWRLPLPTSLVAATIFALVAVAGGGSGAAGLERTPIKDRHAEADRSAAREAPRTEDDQAVVDGWPVYRTPRGQEAFNDAMATLAATEGPAPPASAFNGCKNLACPLRLPKLSDEGWMAAGRLWLSAEEYVLIVRSPRLSSGRSYSRRSRRNMKYFVLHEFHNSSRNTDTYDTISSHKSYVFVPFYMSKQRTDAKGRRFVVVVQVAPHDVESVHATNHGSAGPGIEVAKNSSDDLQPLQARAGILVATILKTAEPRLEVVNHRGEEGLPMLEAYENRLRRLRTQKDAKPLELPFTAVDRRRLAAASGRLYDLVLKRGTSPPIPMAERGIVPRRVARAAADMPKLIGPIRPAMRPTMHSSTLPEPILIVPTRPAVRPLRPDRG